MDKLKLAALGERLKTGGERLKSGGAEMSRKLSGKMKEILQSPTLESKMVDEATLDTLEEPDWGLNLRICGHLSRDEFSGSEVMKAIKKKIAGKNVVSQRLSLDLLEACAMNCDKVFSQVASEKVLDEMVKMIDNSHTDDNNRQRALQLIQAWGESEDLGYLPIFHQTYMNLRSRKASSPNLSDGNATSIFSPIEQALYPPEGYPYANVEHQNTEQFYQDTSLSVEEKRELLTVTRNSMEILSTLLNSENPQEVLEGDLAGSLVDKCKDSLPVVQRILETVGNDEALLFEALSLHEELEEVLCKYANLEEAVPAKETEKQDRYGSSSTPTYTSSGFTEEKKNPEPKILAMEHRVAVPSGDDGTGGKQLT